VTDQCPHCGARLPPVRDPFCPECRGPLGEDASQRGEVAPALAKSPPGAAPPARGNPLARFTIPARLVIVLSLFAALGGTVAYIGWVFDGPAPGSYPLWFFILPAMVAAGALCAGGLGLLRVCGVSVFRKDRQSLTREGDDHPQGDRGWADSTAAPTQPRENGPRN
jgi:hypothetical protein